MDKQIIIDDVDISGCEYCLKMTKYRCTIQRDVYKCLCEENPNCHYKQLKRKEQECELLKEDEKSLLNVIDHLQKQKNEWEEKYNDLGQDFDQLKAKNIKIYKTFTEIKKIADKDFRHTAWEEYAKQLKQKEQELQAQRNFTTQEQRKIYCVAYDKTCETGNECKQKKCVFKDRLKYKQALNEIEKYLDAQQKYFDGEDYHNLLDIINKVKENK